MPGLKQQSHSPFSLGNLLFSPEQIQANQFAWIIIHDKTLLLNDLRGISNTIIALLIGKINYEIN